MRKRVFAIILTIIFITSQIGLVYAKGYSGRRSSSSSGRSYSSKSSSYSSSYSGRSKSSSGYSGSSSSSSSRNPGSFSGSSKGSSSYSGNSSSGSSSSTSKSSRTDTMKNSYMSDTYKKQASKTNYNAYKQNLNSEQKKAYDASTNRNYNVNNRMNFENSMNTKPQRITVFNSRPIYTGINPYYFGGPLRYGSGFVGPWDLFFLTTASNLFWHHHWSEIYAHRDYFSAADFAAREKAVRELEAQKVARNSSYLDPSVDPDLQFSNDYLQKNPNSIYYTNKKASSNPFVTIIIIILVIVLLVFIIKRFSKKKPKKSFESRIY